MIITVARLLIGLEALAETTDVDPDLIADLIDEIETNESLDQRDVLVEIA